MAEIALRRLDGYRIDRRRAYRVFIDGQRVGDIKSGQTEVFEVSPGQHELQLKVDWTSSEKLQIEVGDGGQAELVCKPRITDNKISVSVGFRALYWTTWGRKRYIDLQRDGTITATPLNQLTEP
jgi:hypothetical protein